MSKTPRTDDESTLAAMVRELDAKLAAALAAKERAEVEQKTSEAFKDFLLLKADRFNDGIDWIQSAMQAEAERDALAAKLADADRDAERYRWLRGDTCPDHSIRWTQWEVRRWDAPFWTMDLRRNELDAAIDAAMEGES